MFSSLTDRFFHGMNKRHTKLIETGEIKAHLQSSRSNKNSHSKSKTARLFDNSNISSKRSSLNNTLRLQTQTQAQFFNLSQDRFVPPSPSAQAQSQKSKRKNNLSKTSSQFTPLATTADLQEIVRKHLDKEKDNDQQNSSEVERFKQLGSVLSIKDKLRRKIQSNAFKRFSNIHASNGNTRSERVDQKHIRQLLAIVKKENDNKLLENQKTISCSQSIPNSTQDTQKIDKASIITESKKRIETFPIPQNKQLKLPTKDSERKIVQPQIQSKTQYFRKESEKSEHEKPKIEMAKDQMEKKQLKKIHPAKTQQIHAAGVQKISKPVEQKKNKPYIEKASQRTPNLIQKTEQSKKSFHEVEKVAIDGGFLTELATKNEQKTKQKNPSSKSIQQSLPIKTAPQVKQPAKQKIVKVEDLDQDEIEEVVFNDRNTKLPKPGQDKTTKLQPQPQIPKKDLEKQKQAQKQREKQQKEKQKKQKQKQKRERQQKQKQKNERQRQREREREKEKQLQAQRKEKQNQKKQVEDQDEQEYELEDIVEEIKSVFYLISQVGNYSVSEKSFMQEVGIQELQKISQMARFYIWQQFYFLEHQALQILKNKSQDLYEVPANLLKEPDLQQHMSEIIASQRVQLSKIVKKAQKLYDEAKNFLPEEQKPLTLNPKISFLKKCQKILQQQFLQIQKFYRMAVRKNQKNQQKLLRRLCQIIQVFCLLKYLNGQKTKQYIEIDDIDNHNLHYQNNKHLIAL